MLIPEVFITEFFIPGVLIQAGSSGSAGPDPSGKLRHSPETHGPGSFGKVAPFTGTDAPDRLSNQRDSPERFTGTIHRNDPGRR
jgi:hypothetical protein